MTYLGVSATSLETAQCQEIGSPAAHTGGRKDTRAAASHLYLSEWSSRQSSHCMTAFIIMPMPLCRQLKFLPENRISQATHLSHGNNTSQRNKLELNIKPLFSCVSPMLTSLTESLRPKKVFVAGRGGEEDIYTPLLEQMINKCVCWSVCWDITQQHSSQMLLTMPLNISPLSIAGLRSLCSAVTQGGRSLIMPFVFCILMGGIAGL